MAVFSSLLWKLVGRAVAEVRVGEGCQEGLLCLLGGVRDVLEMSRAQGEARSNQRGDTGQDGAECPREAGPGLHTGSLRGGLPLQYHGCCFPILQVG